MLAGLVLLSLAACASFPTRQYNKLEHGDLHSVAIAPIGMPDSAQVVILHPVGANFGLIGALVETARTSEAKKEASEEFAAAHFDYAAYLSDRIAAAMKGAGFEVTELPGSRPAAFGSKFLDAIPDARGARAVLDVYVSYLGYVAAGATTDYHPAVHIEARLLDATSKSVLFADQIYYYNFSPQFAKTAITVDPAPQYSFKDRGAMKADPQRVAAGIKAGIDAAAAELTRQFQ